MRYRIFYQSSFGNAVGTITSENKENRLGGNKCLAFFHLAFSPLKIAVMKKKIKRVQKISAGTNEQCSSFGCLFVFFVPREFVISKKMRENGGENRREKQ